MLSHECTQWDRKFKIENGYHIWDPEYLCSLTQLGLQEKPLSVFHLPNHIPYTSVLKKRRCGVGRNLSYAGNVREVKSPSLRPVFSGLQCLVHHSGENPSLQKASSLCCLYVYRRRLCIRGKFPLKGLLSKYLLSLPSHSSSPTDYSSFTIMVVYSTIKNG